MLWVLPQPAGGTGGFLGRGGPGLDLGSREVPEGVLPGRLAVPWCGCAPGSPRAVAWVLLPRGDAESP